MIRARSGGFSKQRDKWSLLDHGIAQGERFGTIHPTHQSNVRIPGVVRKSTGILDVGIGWMEKFRSYLHGDVVVALFIGL